VSDAAETAWIFGYGSLMWNPGFPFEEQHTAELDGYHRSFCVYSHHHRGTAEIPGLVLGLDHGGRCIGIAYRVAADDWAATIRYLDDRELIANYPYVPRVVALTTRTGRINAHTYVADPGHANFAGTLAPDQTVAIIRAASGLGGSNRDYLIELIGKLEALDIEDRALGALLARVRAADGN